MSKHSQVPWQVSEEGTSYIEVFPQHYLMVYPFDGILPNGDYLKGWMLSAINKEGTSDIMASEDASRAMAEAELIWSRARREVEEENPAPEWLGKGARWAGEKGKAGAIWAGKKGKAGAKAGAKWAGARMQAWGDKPEGLGFVVGDRVAVPSQPHWGKGRVVKVTKGAVYVVWDNDPEHPQAIMAKQMLEDLKRVNPREPWQDDEDQSWANEQACASTASLYGHSLTTAQECDDGAVGCLSCPFGSSSRYIVTGARGAVYGCDTLAEARKMAGKKGTIQDTKKRNNPRDMLPPWPAMSPAQKTRYKKIKAKYGGKLPQFYELTKEDKEILWNQYGGFDRAPTKAAAEAARKAWGGRGPKPKPKRRRRVMDRDGSRARGLKGNPDETPLPKVVSPYRSDITYTIVNPSDHQWVSKLYQVQFSTGSTIFLLVWANSFDQALVEAAEWAETNAPGIFEDAETVAEAEAEGWIEDLTYTESGYINSSEWFGGSIGQLDDLYEEAKMASEKYSDEEEA
ncbi:MAG: hypothetical protein HN929_11580 [Chloroflexi bacterium]|jgi:hypothetical protein|nr:hypothetical protein [Chloroflexota bacterium]